MEKKSKKSVVIGITILLLVTLILLGLTYAYYRTRIVGNEEEKSISVTSKKLEVTYSDDKAVIEAEGIEPGYTATKTFTVENTGSEPTNFGIVLDNVENTFTRKSDWTFVLKQGETVIREGVVPSSKTYIANTISIASNETIEYTLTINYANLTKEDQSEDMGSTLSLRVNIDNETGTILESAEEGTLLAAIANDNLISEPWTPVGKMSSAKKYVETIMYEGSTKKLTIEEQESLYFIYADSYAINQATGMPFLINPKIGLYKDIYQDLEGKYLYYHSGSTNSTLPSSTENAYISKVTKATNNETNTFTYTAITGGLIDTYEAVLSTTEDDYGISYYFRGLVENNFITYSGMCWRIVRVQGNGTIKLILADASHVCGPDTEKNSDGTYSGYSTKNSKSAFLEGLYTYQDELKNDVSIMDYEASNVVTALESWIVNKNDSDEFLVNQDNLETAEWCIDLSESETHYWDNSNNEITDPNSPLITYIEKYYSAYDRIENKRTASLKCDTIGVNNSTTKKHISNVGLLTADEAAFAGAITDSNDNHPNFYLKTNAKGSLWWTLTPAGFSNTDGVVYGLPIFIGKSGALSMNDYQVNEGAKIRPSIVLKNNVTIQSGNGTQENPYVVS